MAQTTFALMTNLGRSKEAAAMANNTAIEITEIAIGNGTTVPSGGETKLYNEIDRKKIVEHGLVAGSINVAYFDIFLSATDGPYQISEAGLYDNVGDLIAIAYYNPTINKPTPESGQTVEGTIRIEVAFSNVENIIVQVDSNMQVPLQRLTSKPFVPVFSINTLTPPANPNIGDCYLIPINATGAWINQANKLAEYTNAGWSILNTPNGHGIGLADGSFYIKINGVYILYQDFIQNHFDTRYLQPSAFIDNALLSENGYQILPNGLILQWGYYSDKTVNLTNGVYESDLKIVLFPLTFPNKCLSVTTSAQDVVGVGRQEQGWVTTFNQQYLSLIVGSRNKNDTVTCNYFAIGY